MKANKIKHWFGAVRIFLVFSIIMFFAACSEDINNAQLNSVPDNQAPAIEAVQNQTITLPENQVRLNATVTDDGLPEGSTLTYTWVQESGPETVTFNDSNALDPVATFNSAGNYVFQFTVSDSNLSASDTVTITVIPEPEDTQEQPVPADISPAPQDNSSNNNSSGNSDGDVDDGDSTDNNTGEFSPDAQFEDDFNGAINESVWQIATWVEHGGQTGRDRCYTEDGNLNMVFINDSTDGYLSSAIQTRSEFLYGRWEARLKPSSVPVVLNSFYTIDWGTSGEGTRQEIDIEFLTSSFGDNSGRVHVAVHARGLTSFQTNPDTVLNFNPSDDFHVWGFEITPEHIQWFVDDQILLTYTYSENDITIDSAYQLKLNVWSAAHWINGPPEEDTECIYQIDWIKFYPYIGQ